MRLGWVLVLLVACDCGAEPVASCTTAGDCPSGICIDGECRAGSGDAGPSMDALPPTEDAMTCASPCGALCCEASELCRFDMCVSDLGPCSTNDDCGGDSYCDSGRCIPYGIPPEKVNDPMCERQVNIDAIVPEVQCRWTGPPEGDAAPSSFQVMATPAVVDFQLDGMDPDDADFAPMIAFASFPTAGSYSNPGVLRIIDGRTCEQRFSFPDAADAIMAPAPVAVGDIDGDGRAEVVAAGHSGGLKAFAYDEASGTFARIWTSANCADDGSRVPDNVGGLDQWSGPSIHDLDNDGLAELIYGATVYDNMGCVITSRLGFPSYSRGMVPVIADVDEDQRMELLTGSGLFEYDSTMRDWVAESYFVGSGSPGQVAVAELVDMPLAGIGGRDLPEIAIVSAGTLRVETLEGTVVFGPVAIPGGGTGGAPTIADFDGDGRREIASAGGSSYVVFDLDCTDAGAVGACVSGTTNGILWTQPSQDASSNVTGSSVFDFDADGAAEAVYADECYLRIYDGATGEVRYSAARSSGTTYENPVIVDVDGDFHSEIVSAVNDYAGTLGCAATDPLRAEAVFETNHGIVVFRDVRDRWAVARPVWNQHAYAVTHVGVRGSTPSTTMVSPNWGDSDLNNFRQNIPGELAALGVADLTAASQAGPLMVACEDGVATLPAQVCNRGTLPLGAGTEIAFRVGDQTGDELCRVPVPIALRIGECTQVECAATLPADEVDLTVVVDPDNDEEECWEGNNFALLSAVQCATVM